MPFSLRIGSALVIADTAAEAAELVRALGAGVPADPAPPPTVEPPPAASPLPPPTVAPASPPSDLQDPAPLARSPGCRQRPKPGSITKRGDSWALLVSVDNKARWAGSFQTREAAEVERDRIHSARLRGEPIPEFTRQLSPRTCRRCGVTGHDCRRCTGVPLPPKVVIAPPPKGTPVRLGTPEYAAKIADAMRASWARRRAAAAQGIPAAAPRPAREATPAPAPRPPVCARCVRLGHVEADCPRAPAVSPDLPTCAISQTDPSCLTEQEAGQLGDDDDGTDLTDLVDVPDAEPTPLPPDNEQSTDFNRGRACGTCGKPGHISVTCPNTAALPRERATHVPPPPPVFRLATLPPRTRGDCLSMPRPCPFVVCRYHLSPHRPGVPLADLTETCTLDLADRGPVTLEEVGRAFGLTRERIRQVETKAMKRVKTNARRRRMQFDFPDQPLSNAPEDTL